MSRLKCYIAGAYSKPEPVANVAVACRFASWLIDHGHNVFVPHLNVLLHFMEARSWDDWLSLDMDWVESCDVLIRLPGESKGADREVIHAMDKLIPYYALTENTERERDRLLHWLADWKATKELCRV